MGSRILLLLVPLAIALSACAPVGKTVFNPNDIGTDISTGGGTPTNGDTSQPGIPKNNPPDANSALPFPDDAQKFNQPWKRGDTQLVLDAYQGNSLNWDKMATDKRVVGMIHRATIGLRVDSLFKSRTALAAQYKYLWGGYALGMPGDPIAQAQLYLQTVPDPAHGLLALDLEDVSNSGFMNIANAQKFVQYIYQQTGRLPIIYTNNSSVISMNQVIKNDPLFAQTRLWYARYRSNIPDFPHGLWPTYFLWQFSSELDCKGNGQCLYNVPGTTYQIDVNVFYGDKAALQAQWQL